MGAWNASSFDNDDAQDWLAELDESENIDLLVKALADVTENEGYVEAPEAQRAVAAAEVVAAMKGYPAVDLPDEAATWSRCHNSQDSTLTSLARQATTRIQVDSELKELWEEDDSAGWNAMMSDLSARLAR